LDAKFLEAAPPTHYRDTLPDDEKKLKKSQVCLRLLPGIWFKVVGTHDSVKLLGKVLTALEHSALQQNVQGSQNDSHEK
jgi:hypothetical protein